MNLFPETFQDINKIRFFIILSFVSTTVFSLIIMQINDTQNISPEIFMDPCNFTDIQPLSNITLLKSKIKILRDKIKIINEIQPYNLCVDSEQKLTYFSTFYEDSINEINAKLEYQKCHRQKCYTKNLHNHLQQDQHISRIVILVSLPLFVLMDYKLLFHFKKSNSIEMANAEERNGKKHVFSVSMALTFNIFTIGIMVYENFVAPPKVNTKFDVMPVF